ncbi:MAG: ribosome small subunit-dependent GTPase A [Succiniclasticum sp.]|nr:ribosome small subunit-dependent GTPase A [Succiniclasticum sp.]
MVKEGRVLRSYSGYYYVDCQGSLLTCKVKGHMKQQRFSLCTGDLVCVEEVPTSAGQEGMITDVLPRKNYMLRPTVANLDLMVLTHSVVQPDFSCLIVDKLLVLAEKAGIPVILVLTKTDLAEPQQIKEIQAVYTQLGYEVFPVSAKTGQGIEDLHRRIEGKITVFGGPSGVGKSTTLNAIQPGILRVTGEISEKIRRGRHTTRFTELVPFNGGYLADTPGFGNVLLEALRPEELADCYPEFRTFAAFCRFHPCSHTHEPDCSVKEAVTKKSIAPSRYESYTAILQELKELKVRNRK